MKVPYSWLREFVPDLEAPPDAVAERLSVSGFAVEGLIRTGGGVSGVVVGEVRDVRQHPNADSLVLVRAFDGKAERDIVCGARNFGPGDRVPLALPGARLPGGVEIARRRVRGETSDGMLCSARELEISDDHSGILVLDADAPLGAEVVAALGLDDVVLHLDVTTNRGDALSVVGIAREVAALYGVPLVTPDPEVPEERAEAAAHASVRLDDARGCPRYLARVIEGVSVGRSPWWIRKRLLQCGMRPISNVVDVTNYVLLERGHPLHAFDLDALAGGAIIVRRPRAGERIATLDGQDRRLERDDVAICDAERPVALAGVMGGAAAEVGDATRRLLLESAYFDPLRIRRTAARLGLRTEASVRFERGADPEAVPVAAARAAELLASVAGGRVLRGAVDAYPRPRRQKAIRLRAARANALLGIVETAANMAAWLRALGCQVEASRTALRVTPPSWRPDLRIEEDLVEEVARLHGYDRIPETLPGGARTGGLSARQVRRDLVRELLLGAGLNEAQTQSLVSASFLDRLGLPPAHARASNPLSEEESVLRPSLLPGLLAAAQRNVARRVLPVSLFEIGTVFSIDAGALSETERVAWVLAGPAAEGWHGSGRPLDYFDAKAALEAMLSGLGVGDWSVRAFAQPVPPFHPARSAILSIGPEDRGIVAELHPRVAAALELPERVAVAELDVAPLVARAVGARVQVPPRFPVVGRDLALVVGEGESAAAVEAAIRRSGGPYLEAVELFDVYRGAPIPAGKVSLAFALRFRAADRTLTDADADAAMAAIAGAARAAGWTVRE